VIVVRQEYTVPTGKVDEALAWLREVQNWECYRLIYPRGCRVYATTIGRVNKVVLEAEFANLQERLACLRYATHHPLYKAWHQRQSRFCLDAHGGYTREGEALSTGALDRALQGL